MKFPSTKTHETGRGLIVNTKRQFEESSKTKVCELSFHISAAKIWNNAPQAGKEAKTLFKAKKEIKQSEEKTNAWKSCKITLSAHDIIKQTRIFKRTEIYFFVRPVYYVIGIQLLG